jgi:lipopolysaccharide/colanic/teichoic acid biosynthesis glycosyltransferase
MKRLFDIFLSSIGLVLSFPLWLLFSLAIKLEDKGPVFYSQERVGKGCRIFKALKFRSMIPNAEKNTGAIHIGQYLSLVGTGMLSN